MNFADICVCLPNGKDGENMSDTTGRAAVASRRNVETIDLMRLFFACLKRWWAILLATIVGGACAFGYTYQFVTPLYESTVMIYVNNQDLSIGNISISASDLTASASLVDVYEVILMTKDTLDVVIEEAGLDYYYTEVEAMLTTSAVNDTQVFQVTVTNPSPTEAQLIASTIGDVLPDVIASIVESADARIVEHAIIPTTKSSPSYSRNTMMGALLGFVIAVGIIVLLEMMDTTIRRESDFSAITNLPVLAYIPDFSDGSEKKSYGKYGSYYYKSAS